MADISITPANVNKTSKASSYVEITFGETITAGQALYRKASTGLYWRSDCVVSLSTAESVGIALTGGAVDEAGFILTGGPIDIGATLSQGTVYVLSEAGGICPITDLTTSDYVTILGVAKTTSILDVDINAYGWVKT